MSLRAVLIDDEELARAHLRKMLHEADVEVLGEGESGQDAFSLTETFRPDVLFLDIEMPDMSGIEAAAAVENLQCPPHVVFVTGYSEYAIQAFERQAFDYLMKPVAPDRLAVTISRARKLSEPETGFEQPHVALELKSRRRLPVRTDYAIRLLKFDQIECAVARDKKVYVYVNGAEQRANYTLTQLESLLPRDEFMRIHASAIARIDLIDAVNFLGNHTYSVTLSRGEVLPVGRGYYSELQRRLGV